MSGPESRKILPEKRLVSTAPPAGTSTTSKRDELTKAKRVMEDVIRDADREMKAARSSTRVSPASEKKAADATQASAEIFPNCGTSDASARYPPTRTTTCKSSRDDTPQEVNDAKTLAEATYDPPPIVAEQSDHVDQYYSIDDFEYGQRAELPTKEGTAYVKCRGMADAFRWGEAKIEGLSHADHTRGKYRGAIDNLCRGTSSGGQRRRQVPTHDERKIDLAKLERKLEEVTDEMRRAERALNRMAAGIPKRFRAFNDPSKVPKVRFESNWNGTTAKIFLRITNSEKTREMLDNGWREQAFRIKP